MMNRKTVLSLLQALSVLVFLLAFFFPRAACAGGQWITLDGTTELPDSRYTVSEYTGTVTITFLGDCTLGGETRTRGAATGFVRTIAANGYDYPLRQLTALTRTDDLTVANLEGVLSDRELEKEKKTFNFQGSAAYTEILTQGGVECVTLANNHSHDYGDAGYADTKAALESAGVAWFGTDAPALWDGGDGVRIGFLGVHYALHEGQAAVFHRQAEALRDAGCTVLIAVMHAGEEYDPQISPLQQEIVSRCEAEGVQLVVGHHPHIVQGYEIREGMPVVYSLGNCVFGGSLRLKDNDALALRAELTFEEGTLEKILLRFHPISATSRPPRNDYSPVFLSGEDAARVLRKMEASTGQDPGAFDDALGASVECPVPRRR